MIEGDVEVLEIDPLPQEKGDRFAACTGFDPRALCAERNPGQREPDGRRATPADTADPGVLLEAGQIEPGDADGDREGGPASQMETR